MQFNAFQIDDLLFEILQFLDVKSLINCMIVCKHWHNLIEKTPRSNELWINIFRQTWLTRQSEQQYKKALQTLYQQHYLNRHKIGFWKSEFKRMKDWSEIKELQKIHKHTDEIWYCSWDLEGKSLFTCGKDGLFFDHSLTDDKIYKLDEQLSVNYYRKLAYIDISPDGKKLLISEGGNTPAKVFLYHIVDGIFSEFANAPYDIYGKWISNKYFIMGTVLWEALDINDDDHYVQTLKIVDSETLKEAMKIKIEFERTTCAHVPIPSRDGTFFTYMTGGDDQDRCEKIKIAPFTFTENKTLYYKNEKLDEITFNGLIVGYSHSNDSQFIFANVRPYIKPKLRDDEPDVLDTFGEKQEISKNVILQMWNIKEKQLLKIFTGHVGISPLDSAFLIWPDQMEDVLVSGSEDGCIFMWNVQYGFLITAIKAHKQLVNCVRVHPKLPLLASASDDQRIGLWGNLLSDLKK